MDVMVSQSNDITSKAKAKKANKNEPRDEKADHEADALHERQTSNAGQEILRCVMADVTGEEKESERTKGRDAFFSLLLFTYSSSNCNTVFSFLLHSFLLFSQNREQHHMYDNNTRIRILTPARLTASEYYHYYYYYDDLSDHLDTTTTNITV